MSMNDPISDALSRLRNAQSVKKAKTSIPASNKIRSVLDVLLSEGYIAGYKKVDLGNNKSEFHVDLKYYEGRPVIRNVKRISKPGRRIYTACNDLPKVYNGLGIAIVSTSKGVLSDYQARQHNVGGELICSVF